MAQFANTVENLVKNTFHRTQYQWLYILWYNTDMVMMVMIWMYDCVMIVEGFQVFQAATESCWVRVQASSCECWTQGTFDNFGQLYCFTCSFDMWIESNLKEHWVPACSLSTWGCESGLRQTEVCSSDQHQAGQVVTMGDTMMALEPLGKMMITYDNLLWMELPYHALAWNKIDYFVVSGWWIISQRWSTLDLS